MFRARAACTLSLLLATCCGCTSTRSPRDSLPGRSLQPLREWPADVSAPRGPGPAFDRISVRQGDAPAQDDQVHEDDRSETPLRANRSEPADDSSAPNESRPAEPIPAPAPTSDGEATDDGSLELNDVVASIHATFPMLQAAYQERGIAAGNLTAAWGAFDTKLKAATENQPLGFYETYRHSAGFSQPLYGGGELFGGYRTGRGSFEPWYLERQTNDGGEFKAGIRVPLLRDREIDARRAELWRATYDRQRAEPEIREQLILFVRDGSVAYWYWVAAGQQYQIGERALELARQRNDQLERKVELGDVDPPVLQDNLRAIAQREAKLIDLRRKLQQAAIKLSLFYRSPDGTPRIPDAVPATTFPNPSELRSDQLDADITAALSARPEIASLDLLARRINVDLSEAQNDMLPAVDAQLAGSQDVGAPTSSKRDKSEFEMEAGLFMDVPLQRRKAEGKMQAARSKLAQLTAKRQFMENKIVAEIQTSFAALEAAYDRLEKARESVRLAEYMADVERRKFDLGEGDLLSVALREQSAIEAAESEVEALLEYFTAAADYDAALANDRPTRR